MNPDMVFYVTEIQCKTFFLILVAATTIYTARMAGDQIMHGSKKYTNESIQSSYAMQHSEGKSS